MGDCFPSRPGIEGETEREGRENNWKHSAVVTWFCLALVIVFRTLEPAMARNGSKCQQSLGASPCLSLGAAAFQRSSRPGQGQDVAPRSTSVCQALVGFPLPLVSPLQDDLRGLFQRLPRDAQRSFQHGYPNSTSCFHFPAEKPKGFALAQETALPLPGGVFLPTTSLSSTPSTECWAGGGGVSPHTHEATASQRERRTDAPSRSSVGL